MKHELSLVYGILCFEVWRFFLSRTKDTIFLSNGSSGACQTATKEVEVDRAYSVTIIIEGVGQQQKGDSKSGD